MSTTEPRCADVGEDGLLARILPLLHASPATGPGSTGIHVGPGDDAAVLASGGDLVVTTDMLVEGRDFHRNWSDGTALGVKAAAQNLADIAAMGARPTGLVVAFGLPGDLPVRFVENLTRGLVREARRAGCAVIGGDLSGAGEVTISVAAFGSMDGEPPVLRSGARPGDVVALAGTAGRAAAGLDLLLAGHRLGNCDPALEALIDAQLAPRPPYASGPAAAAGRATALIDASDGLAQDLGRIAAASAVSIELDYDSPALLRLREELLPAARLLQPDAAETCVRDWLLGGGEDHGLLATFPAEDRESRPARAARPSRCPSLPVGFEIIGHVHPAGPPGAGAPGPGVSVDGQPADPGSGFSHFREG